MKGLTPVMLKSSVHAFYKMRLVIRDACSHIRGLDFHPRYDFGKSLAK